MSKMPIGWHKQTLADAKNSLLDAERQLAIAQDRVDRLRQGIAFRERQIDEADRRGLDEFDADRLLVKRGG